MWKNKVAIVTGAASGIGYLTAERFAMNGVRVALLDVNPTTVVGRFLEYPKFFHFYE